MPTYDIYLNGTAATKLHNIADVFRLNTRSNKRLYVVVVQFF